MITTLIFILYLILVILYIVTYFFIVYHLVKYSLKPSLNALVLPIFIVISTLLLISNIMLFFAIDWQTLLANFPISLK